MVCVASWSGLPAGILGAAALWMYTASTPVHAAPANAAMPFSAEQKTAVEAIIRDYLVKNPEVLVEALDVLQAREQLAEAESQKKALENRKKEIFDDPATPVIGNPKGDATIVEFFDYQCGYCKAAHAELLRLIEQDSNLRLVMKEYPILGPGSGVAARAALAARGQNKYLEMHNALMAHKGQIDSDTVLRLAKTVGVDAERLKKDMEATDIQAHIQANLRLADALGIRGTPGFVIGDSIIPGAIKLDELKRRVAVLRRG